MWAPPLPTSPRWAARTVPAPWRTRLPLREQAPATAPAAARSGAPPTGARLLLVANRLPVTVRTEPGGVRIAPSTGGLATGLSRVHARGDTLWIGWGGEPASSGAPSAGPPPRAAHARLLAERRLVEVPLSADELVGYYDRFANQVLWPVLHDRSELAAHATSADWAAYRAVNARFAETVARLAQPGDRVWVHDYHLLLVPRLLRLRLAELGTPAVQIGVFLHTPVPTLAGVAALPRGAALLHGLLGADVVGVHTAGDAARLAEAAAAVLGCASTPTGLVDGVGDDGTGGRSASRGRRSVHVQVNPMSVDVAAFADATGAAPRRDAGAPLFLGVDRLDYTKGLPQRLDAFERLLERTPALRGHARLLQIAVPTRETVPAYAALRRQVEARVARINTRFGDARWTPVEYVYGTVDHATLVALYRAADVMLVTPLRDGMNLVAKEFVASRTDDDGVLVLSTGAGAAAELRSALLVEPGDVEALCAAYAAALAMSPAERRVRMRRLRRVVTRHDVHQWARVALLGLGRDLSDPPGDDVAPARAATG